MISAIINAFSVALAAIFSFVPRLVGFLVILLIGWLIALGVGKAITGLLHKMGFARLSDRIGMTRLEQRMGIRMDSAQILGKVAFWFIFLIFLVPATDALGLPTVSNTLNAVVDYLPNVFVAILVLFLGTLVGVFAGDLVRGTTRAARLGNPTTFGNITRWAIIGFSALIALQQLQIAPALITVLFTAIVGGLALAFALAFGLGGREPAQRLLSRSEGKLMANRPYDPTQIVQQAHGDLSRSEQMGQQYATPTSEQTTPPVYGAQSSASPMGATHNQTIPPTPQNYPNTTPRRPERPDSGR